MAAIKICENVYSIGVQNPALRVFDIIMKTEYGTSYNAYLIKGSEKNCIIETVHYNFFDEYIDNIKSVLGDTSPDFLIMNHNEPDHSGSVAKLLEVYPDIKIFISKAGAIYLKKITNNPSLNIQTVGQGDILDIGNETLNFINAPFLHWPDSMFTYYGEKKMLFSCDFLGTHYCEPRIFDKYIKYTDSYKESFEYYYKAIFSPFKPYVIAGLEKIATLEFDFVCPSHGPVLSTKQFIGQGIENYRKWSQPIENNNIVIPIFYCSAYGCTASLAVSICEGIKDGLPSAVVELYDLNVHKIDDVVDILHNCNAFLIGSPTINRDAVAPLWSLVAAIDAISMKDKLCAVFGSYGWSGEAGANLVARLKGLKMNVLDEPFKAQFVPSLIELTEARKFGCEFTAKIK